MSDLLLIYRIVTLPVREFGHAWICHRLARRPAQFIHVRKWTCPHCTGKAGAAGDQIS